MSPRRSYALAVVGGVVAGGVGFLATSASWARVRLDSSGMPTEQVSVTGADAVPLVSAMALVVLAGAVAVLATAGRLRRFVGLVIAVAATVGLVGIALSGGPLADAVLERVRGSAAMTGGRADEAEAVGSATHGLWRWVALTGMLAAAYVGGAVAAHGHRWPSMGRRYEAPTARRAERGALDEDAWTALDRGEDPTV